jgi:mono/diheme cytochrome c family protein
VAFTGLPVQKTMKRLLDLLEPVVIAVSALALLAWGYVWWQSESYLAQTYEAPITPITVPTAAAAIEEGGRLARIRGCYWCHGESLEGQGYFLNPWRGIMLVAPNLPDRIRDYSDAEFARVIRYGVRRDGTSLQIAMPSFAFTGMTDEDMGNLLAYIRSLPVLQSDWEGRYTLYPFGRVRHIMGKLAPNVADVIDPNKPRRAAPDLNDPVSRGEYLAMTICTECHGDAGRLRVPVTPDVQIAASYQKDDFVRLMRTGVAQGERPIDYHMKDASVYRYGAMHDAEIDDLYSYFESLR